jgi:TonB family protein
MSDATPTSGVTAAAVAAGGAGVPQMTNAEPPFRYPPALYARKVQGNVTLRLWVDSTGTVRPESTQVAEQSGHAALDSAAVAGAGALRFAPAWRDGRPAGTAILFPVYFRHPEAPPRPGDTVLARRAPTAAPPAAPTAGARRP